MTDIFALKEDNPGVQYWERNPYYWKVDTAGNQLPYADGLQLLKLENPAQVIPGKVMAGELDWPGFWMLDPAELAVYRRNEEAGGYQAHLWTNESTSTTLAVAFNYTHKDPVKREIFNDLRFRQAMSLAINRQEMSDKLFLGQVEPFVPSVPRHWTGFEDWMATHYAEYDVERANQLLDEMGLEWDADRKWRHLLPSFASYLIVHLTLAIPDMIIAETALSFLGLGMRSPALSWGVLLQRAQNFRSIAVYPWLLIPALFVVITVMAFNFLGDGLRDAADPYKR